MAISRSVALGVIVIVVVLIGASAGAILVLNSSNGSVGTVKIFVKDDQNSSSVNWSHVNVTFSSVQVHKSGAGNDSGWMTLSIVNQTIDLAAFEDVSSLLAKGNISTGNYTQIRLIVSQVQGTMTNGTIVDMTVPSGELKINHPFTVDANQTKTFTVDIDLDDSIVPAGGGHIFKPVLGGISEL